MPGPRMPFVDFLSGRARLAIAGAGLVLAGAAEAGSLSLRDASVLAAGCTNCHQASARGGIPGLHGLGEEQLRQRLTAFRAGQVANATVMPRLMRGYDDEQIAALARWFASGRPR